MAAKIEHDKFPSGKNSYSLPYMKKVRGVLKPETLFGAYEKNDGTNAGLRYSRDDGEVFFAKRGSVLKPGETFFRLEHEKIVDLYRDAIIALGEKLVKLYPDMKTFTLFGEMYGSGICKNVTYFTDPNKIGYIAYDLHVINAHDGDNETGGAWIPYDTYSPWLDELNIPYIPCMHRGTLSEMLNLNPKFHSHIALKNGVSVEDNEGNYAEGYVIKPLTDIRIAGNQKIMIKLKHGESGEKKRAVAKEKMDNPGDIHPIQLYITESRLSNVVTKMGNLNKKMMGRVMGEFSKDILKDYLEDLEIQPSKEELKNAKKAMGQAAFEVVDTYFRENVSS